MSNNQFKITVSDWTKINIDNAKFILEQGKSYEAYLVEASNKITNRAFSVLTVLIPVVSTLIALTVSENVKPVVEKDYFIPFLCLTIVATLYIMFELSLIVFPRLFMPFGRSPKDLCVEPFLFDQNEISHSYLALLLNEVETSQYKIEFNKKQNLQRTKKLEMALLYLAFLIVASCLFLLIIFI